MIPIQPQLREGCRLVIFGASQPEYLPLPAVVNDSGLVMTEWELTPDELQMIFMSGRIKLWIYTGNDPLQPVRLEVSDYTAPIKCNES